MTAVDKKMKVTQTAIHPGAILMRDGVATPESLLLETEEYCAGWKAVTNPDGYEIDRRMRKSGWTFFFMAALNKSTAFGFDQDKSIKAAVRNLMRDASAEKCNAFEIESLVSRRFLGVAYVKVSAHSRHFQQNMTFAGK